MDGLELKAYERFKEQAQHFLARCCDLEAQLRVNGPELYQAYQRIDRLEQGHRKLEAENAVLKQKLADLTVQLKRQPKPAPPLVRANIPDRAAPGKPGRKKGHPAALRPMPEKIDVHETVAAPMDNLGKACCPKCRSQLNDVERHERIVEELVPSEGVTTCYHTTSGWSLGGKTSPRQRTCRTRSWG